MKFIARKSTGTVVATTLLLFLFTACKKNTYPPTYTKATLTLEPYVDTEELLWDSLKYFNASANKYEVNTINMFISNITLHSSTGKKYISKKVFYLDPSNASKKTLKLDSIPIGKYIKMDFLLGLDTTTNKSHYLPSTTDNNNMAWPDMMGGGYHFLKFEGHYLDTALVKKGYAIHMGKNENLPSVSFTTTMEQAYWDHTYTLKFNLNEVFANPYTYDLNYEKNYTMSDSAAMLIIKNNITDAFSLQQTH